jgi:menaquinone reductase, molybdopterin-binding-like subunit
MKIARRDVFKFAGGAAAGALFTPLPWRLLDDTAEWSQNWSWIPKLPRGESKIAFSTCTLCPAGCGLRARCVGDRPVSLAGIAGHPLSHGTLCPSGVGGHQVAYQAGRGRQPLIRVAGRDPYFAPVTLDAAVTAIRAAIAAAQRDGGQSIAIFDERPGRVVSLLYRRFAAMFPAARYLVPPELEEGTLRTLETMAGAAPGSFGADLENTRTLVSFGAPVLEAWATLGRILDRRAGAAPLDVIQIEARQSNTASAADVWLPIRPGTDAAMALAVANVILRDGLADPGAMRAIADLDRYRRLVEEYTPALAGTITGVDAALIETIAHRAAANRPAIAVAGGDAGGGPMLGAESVAIAGLNVLLGSVGTVGGIVERRELPVPGDIGNLARVGELDAVTDGAIGVLILGDSDSGHALPWDALRRKLSPDGAVVVSLSPYLDSFARHANYVVPAPAHLESFCEVVTPPCARAASFAVSAPLMSAPRGAVAPSEFLARLTGEKIDERTLLKQRCAAIHAGKRGSVFQADSGKSVALAEIASDDDLWKMLAAGGVWIDEEPSNPAPPRHVRLLGEAPDGVQRIRAAARGRIAQQKEIAQTYPLVLLPYGSRAATESCDVSPLMTKLYQESGLRATSNQARMHPETAAEWRISNGALAAVETPCGRCIKQVWTDPAVMPGVIEAPVAPQVEGAAPASILDVCSVDRECTWRISPARVTAVSRRDV